jgi:hypothetical protein
VRDSVYFVHILHKQLFIFVMHCLYIVCVKIIYLGNTIYTSSKCPTGGLDMIKKVLKLNKGCSVGVGIPSALARELGWTKDDYVSLVKCGNCLHITKVVID